MNERRPPNEVPSEPQAPAPWQPGPVRRGPALIILGIVAFIAVGGALLAVFGAGPKGPAQSVAGPSGVDLRAAPAAPMLARISAGGDPPSDVVHALVVPAAARYISSADYGGGGGPYDRGITIAVDAKTAAVLSFYRAELADGHWKVSASAATADGKGTEIYATHPASDGYYWEIGVGVEPASPSISPALGGDTPAESSRVALRIFQVDDEG